MKKISYLLTLFLLVGCHKMSNELQTVLHKNSICVYSDQEYENSNDNYFVIFVNKIDYSKEYKAIYTKKYEKVNYPLSKNSCIDIPLSVFNEINKGYGIVLDIGRIPDVSDICITEQDNRKIIKKVEAGKEECD